ncbi:MAG: diguanylate cyclase (GGDEF)-like protein [Polaribacter sp.]|jgi:diguanylate cyclase (GGDEF)-like protein
MLENQVTNDVQKQFLRRTPIKLKQFARFLGDIAANEVNELRLKALLSQVTETRESCIEQEFDTTAKILNQLIKQLSMNRESLQSQKPLLLRLAKRLSEHANKLSLGIKPQKKQLKSITPIKRKKNKIDESQIPKLDSNSNTTKVKEIAGKIEVAEAIEITQVIDAEDVIGSSKVIDIAEVIDIIEPLTIVETIVNPIIDIDFAEEVLSDLDNINDDLKNVTVTQSKTDESQELAHLALYHDKSNLIFLTSLEFQTPLELEHYNGLLLQLDSLGIEYLNENNLLDCIDKSQLLDNSIIIAPLGATDELKVLLDEMIEIKNTPLIFTANKDNQENRLRAIRNKGTGFAIEPLSLSCLFDQIELSFDLNYETPSRILVMEDSKAQARYYEKVLQKGHFDIRVVNNPAILLEAIRGFDPETILMDMQMPDSSGIELTQMIRQMPRYAHLPIIFLSAEENLRKQNQAFMSGGTSFIVKPVQKEQLMFMASIYTQKFRSLSPKIDINPDTNISYPNKFKQIIASESARSTRSNTKLALVLIQLDDIDDLIQKSQFSFINNAINQLTQILKKRLRQTDVIGHVGANRLGVILTSGNKNHWSEVMRNIQEQFATLSFDLDQQPRFLSVSMGISEVERNFNAYQWLERSNQALEDATQNGVSQINWIS